MNTRRTASSCCFPAWLLCAALLAASGAPAKGGEPLGERLPPLHGHDDSLIFALRLGQLTLSEELPAIQRDETLLLPLGELCRLLELAIVVDPGRGLAAGFVIEEQRSFALDLKFSGVTIGGQTRPLAGETPVEPRDDDLYVATSLLENWLPLRFAVSYHDLLIRIEAQEALPVQLRLEREKKLAAAARRAQPAAAVPGLELPYRLIDGPFLDASLRYSRRTGAAGTSSSGERSLEYSLAATGELLFLEANLFLFGNQQEILDARLSLGRRDPAGRLLGRLQARELMLGEVFHPGLELVALPRSGPGFLLSSFPLDQLSQFGRDSFRGELLPGWEAELYRGDELLAYVRSRSDGRYEFLDVPLLPGLNEFRVELYGPQGQRQSNLRRLNFGAGLTPPGELYYRLTGNDPGSRLIGQGPAKLGPRLSFELGAGLARRLSASMSLAAVDHGGRRRTYAQAGLRTFSGPLEASLDLAIEGQGGGAVQLELHSRWRRFGLLLQHSEIAGLTSETFFSAEGELRRRSRLRLDTVLAPPFLPRLPLEIAARQDELTSGRRLTEISARVAASSRGFALANQLLYSLSAGGAGPHQPATASGQLLISRFLPALSLRGELDYRLAPRSELAQVAMRAETRRFRHLLVAAGISRAMAGEQTRYELGLSRLDGPFGLTATADFGDGRGFGVSILLSLSLGRDPRDGAWHRQARALAPAGGLSARAFLDHNGNGLFDPGEPLVRGAGLVLNAAGNRQRTDEEGRLFLANLAPHQPLTVALAPATLEDPYWQPAGAAVAIVPRPGKVAVVDFPVEELGEICGTIFLQRGGERRPAGGVEIELVDRQGLIVSRGRSAADGFYDLDRLRPGAYVLRVSPAQVARLQLAQAPARPVELRPQEPVVEDLNFVLLVAD